MRRRLRSAWRRWRRWRYVARRRTILYPDPGPDVQAAHRRREDEHLRREARERYPESRIAPDG